MPSAAFPQYPNVRANMPETLLVVGRISLDATTPLIVAGRGFTVAKAGTGLYRVTLSKRIGRWLAGTGIYHRGDGNNRFLEAEPLLDANNYITFRLNNGAGAAADGASTSEISFILAVMMAKLPVK
jgi:hypothetical protein